MFKNMVRASVGSLSLLLVSGSAAAQYAQPPPPPPPEAEPELKQFAVEGNPLAIFIGRYSVNVEYLPAMHHALVINPHYDNVNATVTTSDGTEVHEFEDSFSGFGAELGYRFYTGRKGPNGFFVGPSALLGFYSANRSDLTGSEEKNFSSYGFALDIGGQGVIGPGVVVGGGFGIQRTWVNNADTFSGDLPLSAEVLVGGGIRPRFLLSVGYAF